MNKWRVMLWKVSQRTGAARSPSVNASLSKVLKIFTARQAQLCRHLSTPLKSTDELSATRRAAADVAGRSVNGKDKEAGFKHGGNGLATVVLIWIILFDCIRVASFWLLSSHFVDFIKHLCYLLCNLVFSVLCAAAITRWHEFQPSKNISHQDIWLGWQICWLFTFLYVVNVSRLVLDTKNTWLRLVKDYVFTRNSWFCCQLPFFWKTVV